MLLSCTIFYQGRLVKKYSFKEFFDRVVSHLDGTGWTYTVTDACLTIDFNDGKSELLTLEPKGEKRCIDGFCKLDFENDDDYNKIFDIFYDVQKMIYCFIFSDDFGLWDDYIARKEPCKIKLRALTPEEETYIRRFGSVENLDNTGNLLLGVIGDEIKKNPNDKITYEYLVENINPNIINSVGFDVHRILETWLFETMTYKNYGRVCDISKDTRGLEINVASFDLGIAETIFGDFGGSMGAKQAQIRKLYEQCMRQNLDVNHNGILMYRFVLSSLEYLGFKHIGRKNQ